MIDGIVSNCFRTQLDSGTALEELIGEASRRGFRAIELRQGCLGEFETTDRQPIAGNLSAFPGRFPEMRFNMAIEYPFLSPEDVTDDDTFSAGKRAADAIVGETPPHLRLVDLTTSNSELDATAALPVAVKRIVTLTKSMIEIDGVLSIEHSRQRWDHFRQVFERSREELGADSDRLRICFDPCNLLSAAENTDPAAVTRMLSADEISMVHLKQRHADELLCTVDDGDVDWPTVCTALNQIGCRGPGLFEITAHADLWDNLEASRDYVRRIGND